MTADAQASHRDRQRIVLRLAELGVPTSDAEGQRHVVAVWTKGAAQKRSELTERQAGSLLARLREMTAEDVAAVLARPRPAAPPCPVDEGAGTCSVPAPQCCAVSPAEDPADLAEPEPPADVEHLADVVELRPALVEPDPVPAAAVEPTRVYPVAPPVVDVEQAAREAVERHLARVAAGTPAQPPAREEIPPRVPVVLPPNPHRQCPPACCYCGDCPTWKPAAVPDYSKTPGSIAYEEAQRWRR